MWLDWNSRILIWNSYWFHSLRQREGKRLFLIGIEFFPKYFLTSSDSWIGGKRTNVSKVFTNFTWDSKLHHHVSKKAARYFSKISPSKRNKRTQYSHFHEFIVLWKTDLWIFDDKLTTNPLINPMAH